MTILAAGSAGSIGANFALVWCARPVGPIVSADKLTHAGSLADLQVIRTLRDILDQERTRAVGSSHRDQVALVRDRPGHDHRYAIDASKVASGLRWVSAGTFTSGIRNTVRWYPDNQGRVSDNTSDAYREWVSRQYQ